MTLTYQVQLTEINCGECSGTYAINERYRQQKKDKGGYWTCPYCKCSWGYGTSTVDELRNELAAKNAEVQRERQRRDQAEADARTQLAKAEKAGKELKVIKERTGNGVCPCCNRTFKNLANHMTCKHPGYGPSRNKPEKRSRVTK